MATTTVISLLKKARENIAKRGWLQNRGSDGQRVCSAMALALANDELYSGREGLEVERAGRVLMKAAEEQTGMHWQHIPWWNDHPGRTKEEVLDTFDHAIKLAERDS